MKTKHFEFHIPLQCTKESDCHEIILAKLSPLLSYENFSCRILHEKNHLVCIDVYEQTVGLAIRPKKIPTKQQIESCIR